MARFVDLGTWAVGHALSVGIFPYVLKLLQSATKELKPWLAFIWAKILAVEPNCQQDLIKEKEARCRINYFFIDFFTYNLLLVINIKSTIKFV